MLLNTRVEAGWNQARRLAVQTGFREAFRIAREHSLAYGTLLDLLDTVRQSADYKQMAPADAIRCEEYRQGLLDALHDGNDLDVGCENWTWKHSGAVYKQF
jgi:hypothetical protein